MRNGRFIGVQFHTQRLCQIVVSIGAVNHRRIIIAHHIFVTALGFDKVQHAGGAFAVGQFGAVSYRKGIVKQARP